MKAWGFSLWYSSDMYEKTCNKCFEVKPLDSFRNQERGKLGKRAECRACEYLKHKVRYLNNPQARRDIEKRYRQRSPEVFARKDKKYYEANRDRVRKNTIEWRKNNPEKYAEHNRLKEHRRRARKLENGTEVYTEKQVLELYGKLCHICESKINLSAPRKVGTKSWEKGLHIDHIVPISKGGSDTLDNVRPAHALCNLKKSDLL